MTNLDHLLANAADRGLCSAREYGFIHNELIERAPCNMLVFGVGFDSAFWLAANHTGLTVFLENNEPWIRRCSILPNIHKVSYGTKTWEKNVIYPAEQLQMQLPDVVEQTPWDIIFVDAPPLKSRKYGRHGRMKSIYQARRLARPGTTVFLHDYNRPHEKLHFDHWFPNEEKTVVHRMVRVRV